MRVLLEEMVLDHPNVVVVEPVGQLDLLQGILKEIVLARGRPRPRQLMLIENAEFHSEGPLLKHGLSVAGLISTTPRRHPAQIDSMQPRAGPSVIRLPTSMYWSSLSRLS